MKFFDKFLKYESRVVYRPLQRKNDTTRELLFQLESLKTAGCEVLETEERKLSKTEIIVYRYFGEDVMPEDAYDISLKTRIIKEKGVVVPEPRLHASFDENYTEFKISDININKELVNEGYGSLLLNNLIEMAKRHEVKKISGWISRVDTDHLDRLVHFYKKNNFKVTLYDEPDSMKIGDLLWQNDTLLKKIYIK